MDPVAPTQTRHLSTFTPQADTSKLIRTYAKDFAELSGQAAVMQEPVVQPPILSETPPPSLEAGVSLPTYDPSPINYADSASPKEFEQEVVALNQSDSVGIFGNSGSLSAPPPSESLEELPAYEPIAPVAAPEQSVEEREVILSRLRAKLNAERAVVQTAPLSTDFYAPSRAPEFSLLSEQTAVEPEPEPESAPSAFFSQTPAVVVAPIAQSAPSPFHTYSSDFSDRIDTAQGSTFSVLAAQSDAGQSVRAPVPKRRTLVPLLAGAAMLVVGIGAVVGAYLFTQDGTVPTLSGVPSLISFDESVEVKGTGQSLMQSISNVAQGGSVQGNVIVTYVTLATSTGSTPQPGGVLIRNLELAAPDILIRNVSDTSTVGVIRAGSEARPFMVLRVTSYERTFAGMLAWESQMATDLGTFYPPYSSAGTVGSSTSASGAAPVAFTDSVVANYDVRVLRDSAGRSIMLYGYRGKDTLIIARDEAAFAALVSRLGASGK